MKKNRSYEWEVTGTPVQNKTVRIPVYVYGKKFMMKLRVKS